MKSPRVSRDGVREALNAVVRARGGIQHKAAAQMGLSRRTLLRYTDGTSVPSQRRSIQMLSHLVDLDAMLYLAVADALGVPPHLRPVQPHVEAARAHAAAQAAKPTDSSVEQAAMTLMLYTVAEANGVAPAAARSIALAVLTHASQRGLDVNAAHALATASVKSREALLR